MQASALAIFIILAVAIVALRARPASVALAGRRPHHKQRRAQTLRGPVQGGIHVGGGGRSVGPRRDAEVTPGEVPGEDGMPLEGMVTSSEAVGHTWRA